MTIIKQNYFIQNLLLGNYMENNENLIPENILRIAQGIEEESPEGELLDEGEIVQLVSFNLDEITYGINILSVHEILRIPNITRVPNTPDFIKGVLNLRGNVIPVVDVRKRFGFDFAQITETSRVIVIDTEGKLIGVLVDSVSQVVRIPERNIDPPSDLIEGVSEDFIDGVGRLKDKLIIILSMEHMLFEREAADEVGEKLN